MGNKLYGRSIASSLKLKVETWELSSLDRRSDVPAPSGRQVAKIGKA